MIYKQFQRVEIVCRHGKKPKRWEKVCVQKRRSVINSPAVAVTPSWMVNHQRPQNYWYFLPTDSKNCLFDAIYSPASQTGAPAFISEPPLCSYFNQLEALYSFSLPPRWLTASCLKAMFPSLPPYTFLRFPWKFSKLAVKDSTTRTLQAK